MECHPSPGPVEVRSRVELTRCRRHCHNESALAINHRKANLPRAREGTQRPRSGRILPMSRGRGAMGRPGELAGPSK